MEMGYRCLDLTIVCAEGLKNVNFFTAMDVYVIVQVLGYGIRENKKRTHIDRNGGTNPRWNHRIKFTIDEPSLKSNTAVSVLFQLKSERIFGSDRIIGEVTIPMLELYEDWVGLGVDHNNINNSERVVDYQVRTSTRKPKGTLKISYKFGENYVSSQQQQQQPYSTEENNNYNRNSGGGFGFYHDHEPVPAFPSVPGTSMPYAAAGIGYPAPYPPPGYGGYPSPMAPCYPPTAAAAGGGGGGGYHNGYAPPQQQYPPPAGYGYPTPAPPIMQQQYHHHHLLHEQQQQQTMKNKGKMGMGAAAAGVVGMGLLGGMLVGDIASDVGEMAAYSDGYTDAMAIGDAGFDF